MHGSISRETMKPQSFRIMVLEPIARDVEQLSALLPNSSQESFVVRAIETLQTALDHLTSPHDSIDLILVNLRLPDSNGLETFTRVFEAAPTIPIVILTTKEEDQMAFQAIRSGAQDLFVKGKGDRYLLLRTIRHSMERKKAEEEWKGMQQQMEYTQRLESLGILAGGIAHDFNNLLMAMVARAGLVLRLLKPDSPIRSHLLEIEKAGLRGGELANQMLTYAGRGTVAIQSVNISKAIMEMDHLLHMSISKRVTIHYQLASNLSAIHADPLQLRQIIVNLVINASEAIGEDNGKITLTTGSTMIHKPVLPGWHIVGELPSGPGVYIEIQDTGCGMSASTIPKIFDPFYTTKFIGRGMGLSVLAGIIRAQKGAIAISSVLGEGTWVRLFFPCAQPKRIEPHLPKQLETSWQGQGTILVVDDEEDVRLASQLILEECGFDVLTAADGQAGLELFKEYAERIQVVLLDLTMPRMNGAEFLAEMQQLDPSTRIILTSGYTEEETVKRFADSGIYGFIQKPYQVETLIEKVRRVLAE